MILDALFTPSMSEVTNTIKSNFRVVLLLCGGNIDTTTFGRCLERGLASEGRLLRFTVTVSDRPGGISELCRILADTGVVIKDIMHERAWLKDIYCVDVRTFLSFTFHSKVYSFIYNFGSFGFSTKCR